MKKTTWQYLPKGVSRISLESKPEVEELDCVRMYLKATCHPVSPYLTLNMPSNKQAYCHPIHYAQLDDKAEGTGLFLERTPA